MSEEKNRKEAEGIVEQIKALVKKGNVTKITIKKDDEVILNLPLNIGLLGTTIGLATAPWALVIAALVTVGTDCKIELQTVDGDVIDADGNSVETENKEN